MEQLAPARVSAADKEEHGIDAEGDHYSGSNKDGSVCFGAVFACVRFGPQANTARGCGGSGSVERGQVSHQNSPG